MANSSINLSSLDFDTLKNNFKDYLKSQSALKDYNFDGSNMSVLLDVMSYNSYLNSFYLNMLASEMFLDSSQKYDSIISHAKELNYVPRSAHTAVSYITFTVDMGSEFTKKLTIPKGTLFTGVNSKGSYIFTTDEASSYSSSNGFFNVANLQIREGVYFYDSYILDYDIENQRLILSNKNVDIDTVSVTVTETVGGSSAQYFRVNNLYGLEGTSNVFFIQASSDNRYEIMFGDGYFGRRPVNMSTISVEYIVTNGSDGNDVAEFTIADDLGVINQGSSSVSTITTISSSAGGANQESIDSVRYAAPRYFATQQRAVASDDYTALILDNFGGEISDVVVFGGETLDPKQYGRVVCYIKPTTGTIAPDYVKTQIQNYLLDYIALPNRVLVSDPDYLYCWVNSSVQYNKYLTDKTIIELESIVLNAMTTYSSSNIEKFGNDLRYSRLVADIDNSDISITSNQTEVRVIKRFAPKLNYSTTQQIDVNNPLYSGGKISSNSEHLIVYGDVYDTHFAHAAMISTKFTYNHTDGIAYPLSYFEDDGNGNVGVYTVKNGIVTSLDIVGSIDYDKGIVKFNSVSIGAYENYISLYFKTKNRDILANTNKILKIDPSDVTITITETLR